MNLSISSIDSELRNHVVNAVRDFVGTTVIFTQVINGLMGTLGTDTEGNVLDSKLSRLTSRFALREGKFD